MPSTFEWTTPTPIARTPWRSASASAASINFSPTPRERASGSTDIVSISPARVPTSHDSGGSLIVSIR